MKDSYFLLTEIRRPATKLSTSCQQPSNFSRTDIEWYSGYCFLTSKTVTTQSFSLVLNHFYILLPYSRVETVGQCGPNECASGDSYDN